MKRLIVTITLVLFHTILCHGQFQIGIVGGTALSGISLPSENIIVEEQSYGLSTNLVRIGKFTNRITGYGGICLNYKITSNFSINAKLLYSVKGWKESGTLDSTVTIYVNYVASDTEYKSNFSDTYTLQYFDLPVQFTFYQPVGKTQIYWGVGPYLSYAIGGYYRGQAFGEDSIGFVNFNHPQTSNSFHGNQIDWGFDLSAGLVLRNGLSFDLSYMAGIRDVLTDRFYFLANRNRVFHFGLTYLLGPSK